MTKGILREAVSNLKSFLRELLGGPLCAWDGRILRRDIHKFKGRAFCSRICASHLAAAQQAKGEAWGKTITPEEAWGKAFEDAARKSGGA